VLDRAAPVALLVGDAARQRQRLGLLRVDAQGALHQAQGLVAGAVALGRAQHVGAIRQQPRILRIALDGLPIGAVGLVKALQRGQRARQHLPGRRLVSAALSAARARLELAGHVQHHRLDLCGIGRRGCALPWARQQRLRVRPAVPQVGTGCERHHRERKHHGRAPVYAGVLMSALIWACCTCCNRCAGHGSVG